MKMSLPVAAALLTACAGAAAQGAAASAAEELLARLNAYRVQQGLMAVPKSPSLTQVAEAHVADLERNPPTPHCNGHSWSPSRRWKACCYTDDHAKAQCMWNKPQEITGGVYSGRGFEIWAQRSGEMTLDFALEGWKSSHAHHQVIINQGPWMAVQWQAVGAAVSQHYAVVWFGMDADPATARSQAGLTAAPRTLASMRVGP